MPPDSVFTSTISPLKRRKRFSRCCPGTSQSLSLTRPRHKEVAILVRIFQRNKTATPTFIHGRLNVCASRDQIFVKLIHIFNPDEEVNATSSAQHRLEMLRQSDRQFPAA